MDNGNRICFTEDIIWLTFDSIKKATKRAKIKEIENLAFECVKEATKKANKPSFTRFIKHLKQNIQRVSSILKCLKEK